MENNNYVSDSLRSRRRCGVKKDWIDIYRFGSHWKTTIMFKVDFFFFSIIDVIMHFNENAMLSAISQWRNVLFFKETIMSYKIKFP